MLRHNKLPKRHTSQNAVQLHYAASPAIINPIPDVNLVL